MMMMIMMVMVAIVLVMLMVIMMIMMMIPSCCHTTYDIDDDVTERSYFLIWYT